jgi:hypothetical protein
MAARFFSIIPPSWMSGKASFHNHSHDFGIGCIRRSNSSSFDSVTEGMDKQREVRDHAADPRTQHCCDDDDLAPSNRQSAERSSPWRSVAWAD